MTELVDNLLGSIVDGLHTGSVCVRNWRWWIPWEREQGEATAASGFPMHNAWSAGPFNERPGIWPLDVEKENKYIICKLFCICFMIYSLNS